MHFEKVSFEVWSKDVLDVTNINRKYNYLHQLNVHHSNHFPNLTQEDYLRMIWEHIELPRRSTVGSAGYDFFSPVPLIFRTGDSMTIPTGIKWFVENEQGTDHPERYTLMIYPRSSLGRDWMLRQHNSVSVVDSDYYGNPENEGHIRVTLKSEIPELKAFRLKEGQAYCQGVIQRFYLVDDDNVTDRRVGGFGSTTSRQIDQFIPYKQK